MPNYLNSRSLPGNPQLWSSAVNANDITLTLPDVLIGDATLDGRVTSADAFKIIQHWGDLSGQRNWLEGDLTFDGNVTSADAFKIIQSWQATTDVPVPGVASATYNTTNGEVRIWTHGVSAVGIYSETSELLEVVPGKDTINAPGGTLFTEDFRPVSVVDFAFFSTLEDLTDHVYFVIPAGIPNDENFDLIILYLESGDPTEYRIPVEWVPEPATMALLLMGGTVVLSRRRRK